MFYRKRIEKLEAENAKLRLYLNTVSQNFIETSKGFDVRLKGLENPPVQTRKILPSSGDIIRRMELTGEAWDEAKNSLMEIDNG